MHWTVELESNQTYFECFKTELKLLWVLETETELNFKEFLLKSMELDQSNQI